MSKSLGRGLSSLIPNKKSISDNNRIIPGKFQDDLAKPIQRQPLDHSKQVGPGVLTQRRVNQEILQIAPSKIKTNPHQPRRYFEEEGIKDLVESIKVHGILQPLTVTKSEGDTYELVAGERRLRAAKQARFGEVPVIVRNASELEKLELSLIENIQRRDLNPIERAVAYKKLIDEFSLTHEKAAHRLGKSRPVVSNTLRLLDLPGKVQDLIGFGKIHETHALAVLELDDAKSQIELAERIARDHLTKEETRREVKISKSGSTGRNEDRFLKLAKRLEQELSSSLKARVQVVPSGKIGWRVTIDAHDQEELIGIVKRMIK